jgi:hypothetical protein
VKITHVMIYDAAGGDDAEDVTVAAIRPDGSVELFPDDPPAGSSLQEQPE